MKKLLLSAAFAIMSFAAFAQEIPNATQWKIGDDISEAVGFGNLSFENDPMDFWQVNCTKGDPNKTGGVFEIYDGSGEVFQCILLPAGMYELNCQGYYRFGTSWDVDPNTYENGTWENLSQLYATAGTYDIESKEFVASGTTFSNPLMPRLFEEVYEQIYVGPKEGEEGYPGWDMSDGSYYDGTRWGPCSIPGSLAWFASDKYLPFESDEDETVYNKVTFFVTEASWVKIGVSKFEEKAADSFMATNFHLIYKGDADEAAKIALAYKSLEIAQRKAEALADEIIIEYPALGALLMDEIMDLDYDDDTVEGIEAATVAFNEIYDAYVKYYEQAKMLSTAITTMDELAAATDYEGKDIFMQAIDAARVIEEASDQSQISGPEAYLEAYNTLNEARGIYVLSRPAVDGVYNYSDLINQPFFCNNEYNPTWDEDLQQFIFNQDIEETWCKIQEQGYSEAQGEHADWIDFCSNVTIATSGSDEGRWVIKSTTWHGGNPAAVTMQHGYPAIGGWTAEPSGNPELLHQTITNLPNGYYSMSALMCNVQTISDLQYVYIEGTGGVQEKANLTMGAQGWWGGWTRNSIYERLETGMVEVTDGKVTIGSSSDSFYAVTGFQLYYYGETPDFTAMIQKKLANVSAQMENLTFPGDYAYVDALLKTLPAKIEGFDGYDAANKTIAEIEEYINTAYNYLNNWKLGDDIANAQANYDENSAEYKILDNMFDYYMTIGTGETDTYKTAQEASELYNQLSDYFTYREKVAGYADYYPVINDIIADQNTGLLAGVTSEKLEEYTKALEAAEAIGAAADVRKVLEPLGLDKATPENPVDITVIVKNPNYDEGSTGWDGAITVDSRLHNAERYNTQFDVSQTIKSLPAGCYLVKVQAYYRDGGSAGSATSGVYYNWWTTADGDIDSWENKNVELYARTGSAELVSYVQSLASVQYTEPGTDKIFNKTDDSNVEQATDEDGNLLYDDDGNEIWTDPDTLWYTYDDAEISWTLDQRVYITNEEGDTIATYYYPNSMEGANARFNKTPEAYQNEVAIMIPEGGNLTFGIRKSTEISNDWCMFDNWKLFYLGKDAPEGIEAIAADDTAAKGIFNIAGQKLNKLQRGLNIVDGKKIFIK